MNENVSPDVEIKALLTELWQRHLPSMHERLSQLDKAASLAMTGQLGESDRSEAQSVAHKLAGNLGMFGHAQAGDIASNIEQILKAPTHGTPDQLNHLTLQLREILKPYL